MDARTRRSSALVMAGALGVGLVVTAAARADVAATAPQGLAADYGPLRALPIQANGRVKPLDTFAREHLYAVTGEYALRDAPGEDPMFSLLHMALEPEKFRERRVIVVRNLDLTEAFTGSRVAKTHVSVKDFEENPRWRSFQESLDWAKEKGFTPTEIAARELFGRVHAFKKTPELLRLLPVSDDPEKAWLPIDQAHQAFPDGRFSPLQEEAGAMSAAFRARDGRAFGEAAGKVTSRLVGYDFRVYPPDSVLSLELLYNRLRPFRTAYLLCFLAAALFMVDRLVVQKRWLWATALAILGTAAFLHVGGVLARTYITQFAPVGSLYETAIWIGGVAVLMAFVFEAVMKGGSAGTAGALLGGVTLVLADRLPLMGDAFARHIDPAMNPLVPVLRSYWLNIHVTCMLTSYGALGLACALGLDYLFVWLTSAKGDAATPEVKAKLERLELFNYRVIQVGFVLLTAGVLLGAVWANQSWGRYWGWDPKETWAFITWLVYAAYLHFRFMGWVKGPWSTVWNLVGFAAVMFTYLGVSFLLPGLHSYLEPS
ncbi:MAG: c-type cytochrome biogenesis protein CcsB [Planctomycetota bacterium]|nr:c-type cytochrome biogenesis protein CcsB [Planctomycetota bacterium]